MDKLREKIKNNKNIQKHLIITIVIALGIATSNLIYGSQSIWTNTLSAAIFGYLGLMYWAVRRRKIFCLLCFLVSILNIIRIVNIVVGNI